MIIDLHVHTVRGSSDSALGLEELLDQAVAVGVDGLAITEHNFVWHDREWDAYALSRGVRIFHGIEVSTDCGHILAFGIEGYASGIHRAAVLREVADQSGAALISAHPFRRAFDAGPHIHNLLHLHFPTVEDAAAHPVFSLVDAVESLNSGTSDVENDFARDVATAAHLPMTGSSDSHSANSIGHRATVFDDNIESLRDLIAALKGGRCRPIRRDQFAAYRASSSTSGPEIAARHS